MIERKCTMAEESVVHVFVDVYGLYDTIRKCVDSVGNVAVETVDKVRGSLKSPTLTRSSK